jgi:hypothetical protein
MGDYRVAPSVLMGRMGRMGGMGGNGVETITRNFARKPHKGVSPSPLTPQAPKVHPQNTPFSKKTFFQKNSFKNCEIATITLTLW